MEKAKLRKGLSHEEASVLLACEMPDKIEELTKIQVEAIKNLSIDKITVWDSMNGKDGSPTTANFLAGMMKSIPPLNETFKMAGLQIPSFLGKEAENAPAQPVPEEENKTPEETKEPAAE